MSAAGPDTDRAAWACGVLRVVLVVVLALGWLFAGWTVRTSAEPGLSVPLSVSPTSETTVLLRIAGDDATATTVVPFIARDYLEDHGARTVRSVPAAPPWTTEITGELLSGRRASVLIRSSSSRDGIEKLIHGDADIAMSALQLTPDELRQLALPDGPAGASAVVPLGRIAIVPAVHPSNPVSVLTFDQLKGIYVGRIVDWATLGGTPGPIHVIGRSPGSASHDVIKLNIMGDEPFAPNILEADSYQAVHDMVASDPAAIGYLPLGAISLLKPIRLQTATGHYVQSDDYGVATKDFPLELTLLLYRSLRENNKEAEDFLRHARSTPAQVAAMFVGLSQITPQLLFAKLPESAPNDYRKAVANGLRVSITIRFAPGSTDLDPGSARDLDALARYLRLLHVPREKLRHIAFSEDTGDPGENKKIATHLGTTVARELRHRHVRTGQVIEFGAAMPLASDSIPAGRNRNRRVETWILP